MYIRAILFTTCLLLSIAALARFQGGEKDNILSLSGTWQFSLDPDGKGITEQWYNQPLPQTIALPGTTDEAQKGNPPQSNSVGRLTRVYEYYGAAWYQHPVTIPQGWAGKHITLLMERTKLSSVWVDGTLAGTQSTLAGKQEYDLSSLLTPGNHRITVRIDNKTNPPIGDPHQISDNTQTNWNGIIGRIELQAHDAVRMQDVQLYPNVKEKQVQVRVKFGYHNTTEATGSVIISAATWNTASTQKVAAKSFPCTTDSAGWVQFSYPLGNGLQLWDEFSPALYRFTIRFMGRNAGGTYTDSREINTGIRDFTTKGTQFSINGKTIFIRGKHDACVFPLTGHPPMTVEGWVKVFRTARSYGINTYRFHSWCPPEAAFQAADIVGMYLQPELPIWGSIGKPGEVKAGDVEQRLDNDPMALRTAYLLAEGRNMLHHYGNHASFVMFALGNELTGSREVMADMIRQYRAYDGRHLYAQGSNNFLNNAQLSPGDDFWTTTLTGGHYGAGKYSPDTKGKDVRSSYPADTVGHLNNVLAGTLYNYTSGIAGVPVPVIGHEVGQYQVYPNFAEINKYTGVVQAKNFEVFRQRLEAAGMGNEADRFFKASGALAVICYREEIETALRTPGFGGFHLLDLQDFPGQGTALVGILDAFMDSKGLIAPEEWRQFCSAVVPLVKMPSYVWTADQPFTADLEIANYGPAAFSARPTWTLTNAAGTQISTGTLAAAPVAQGKITGLGKVNFALTSIAVPQKLLFTLQVGSYRNTYPLWVYPRKQTPDTTGITIAHRLDAKTMAALANGQKVLFFPAKEDLKSSIRGNFQSDFWSYSMFKKYSPAGTLGILCNPQAPALRGFPTESHSNWQWWRLVKNSPVVVLNTTAKTYEPLVQVVDNIDRNHKLGLVFEGKVGKGALLVCSMPLPNLTAYPEAACLYRSLVSYMKSPAFAPADAWEETTLNSLFTITN